MMALGDCVGDAGEAGATFGVSPTCSGDVASGCSAFCSVTVGVPSSAGVCSVGSVVDVRLRVLVVDGDALLRLRDMYELRSMVK